MKKPSLDRSINTKAILWGLFGPVTGYLLIYFVIFVALYIYFVHIIHVTPAQQASGIRKIFYDGDKILGPWKQPLDLLEDLVFKFLGGFIAGKIAKNEYFFHGIILGILFIIMGVLLAETKIDEVHYKLYLEILDFIFSVPATVFGAAFAKRIILKNGRMS